MLVSVKLSLCCTLVLLMATNSITSSPVDDADNSNDKVDDIRANSLSTTDGEQETLSEGDVTKFINYLREFNSQSPSNDSNDKSASVKTSQSPETSVKVVEAKYDVIIYVVIGAASAGLLILLAITVVSIYVCCSSRTRGNKDMSLNKDLNRWDPQLLRPSKSNIDAFIFGSPIPSVNEMIKHDQAVSGI